MSYDVLANTGRPSEDFAKLNGVTTRRKSLEFVRHQDSVAPTARGTNGHFFQEGFATAEKCHAKWLMCDRLAGDVAAVLTLHFAMQTGGAGSEEASFDVGYVVIDTTIDDGITELTTQTPTVVNGPDRDVSAFLAGGHFKETYAIPVAALTAGGLLGFEIGRVAPAGTDHPSDIGLIAVEIQYEVNR
jgi:hypothetical protein